MARKSWYSWPPALPRGQQRGAEVQENNPLPLSDAQLGIWFAQTIDQSSSTYNLAEYLEIGGPVDATLFEVALRQVVAETEALHVRFVSNADMPGQIIGPAPDWSMSLVDVSGAPDPQAAAERWMRADLAKPVDLTCGPLFAYALLKAAADRFFWYSRYHHIVMDGFGFALVARRVADVYSSLVAGRAAEPGTFGSIAPLLEDEAGYRRSKRFEQDRQFWIDYLADLQEPASLGERARPAAHGFIRHSGLLPFSRIQHLHSVAHRAGVSLPQFVIAAAAIFVHRLTGAQDVIVDVPLTGRMTPAARRAPWMMSNVLPLRLAVRADMSVSELAAEATRRMRHVIRHQRYNVANLRRDIGRADQRMFGPTINFMPFDYNLHFDGYPVTAHNLSNGPVDDLSIVLYDRLDSRDLRIDFDGNPALYSADRLAELQQRFLRLLGALADPDQLVGRLDILGADERHTILREWNATARAVPGATLPELFAAQVARTPEADAVVFEDERLSYGELDARSSRLAHHLRGLGVGPEVVVGLCIERSLAMLVGLLGILKAGGAYLPLDPDYPPERLAFMLADAGAPVLLTRAALRAHLPAHDAHVVCLDADWPAIARQPATAPATGLSSATPRLRHLHLRLHRNAKGRRRHPRGIHNLAAGAESNRFDITPDAASCSSHHFSSMQRRWKFGGRSRGLSWSLSSGWPAQIKRSGACIGTSRLSELWLSPMRLLPSGGADETLPDDLRLGSCWSGGEFVCCPHLVARWSQWPTDDQRAMGRRRTTVCATMSAERFGGRDRSSDRPSDLEHAGLRFGRRFGACTCWCER